MGYDGSLNFDTLISTDGFKNGLSKIGGLASKGFSAVTKVATATSTVMAGLGVKCVNLASDLTEVQNVVDVTFGSNASKINDWAKNAATSFGMSELQAKQFNGTLGAMLKSMGLADDQVLNMSESMVGLSGDFASFYNLDPAEAFEKIRSGISGETEPLKQLGINMSVANLEAYALSQGINKTYNSMSQAEQATLRYNYLMSVSADAQGDFQRTSGSLANQLRIMKLNVSDLGASIGAELLPMAQGGTKVLNGMVSQLKTAFDNGGFEGLASKLGDVVAQLITKIAGQIPKFINMGVSVIKSFISGIQSNLSTISNAAVQIITSLVNATITILPQVIILGIQLFSNLLTGIVQALPQIIPTIQTAIMTLVTVITQNLPTIINSGVQILLALIQGISTMLPTLIPTIIDAVLLIQETLINNIDTLVDAGIQLIFALAEGLINALPTIIEKVPVIINTFWDAFDRNLGKILQAGIQLILKLGAGIIQSIPVIIANAGEIVKAIFNTIMHLDLLSAGKALITKLGSGIKSMGGMILNAAKEVFNKLLHPFKSTSTFKEIGHNLLMGLKDGITGAVKSVVSSAKNAVGKVVDGIKNFLGIHSPSKLMQEEVGKFMAKGVSLGFELETNDMSKGMNKSLDNAVNKIDTHDLLLQLENGVNYSLSDTTSNVTAKNITNNIVNNSNNQNLDKMIASLSKVSNKPIAVIVEIDGKEVMKATAPYQKVWDNYNEGR